MTTTIATLAANMGDVIDFTAKLYGLSLYDAAKKLAYDFGITQDKPPTKAMQEKQNGKAKHSDSGKMRSCAFLRSWSYYRLPAGVDGAVRTENTGGHAA